MTAALVDGALVIDGRVSDAASSRAVPVKSLYQRETFEGARAFFNSRCFASGAIF